MSGRSASGRPLRRRLGPHQLQQLLPWAASTLLNLQRHPPRPLPSASLRPLLRQLLHQARPSLSLSRPRNSSNRSPSRLLPQRRHRRQQRLQVSSTPWAGASLAWFGRLQHRPSHSSAPPAAQANSSAPSTSLAASNKTSRFEDLPEAERKALLDLEQFIHSRTAIADELKSKTLGDDIKRSHDVLQDIGTVRSLWHTGTAVRSVARRDSPRCRPRSPRSPTRRET